MLCRFVGVFFFCEGFCIEYFCLVFGYWVCLSRRGLWKPLHQFKKNKIKNPITDLWFSVMNCFLFQRKSGTGSRTSVMTWTWTIRALRAAPACLDTRPAVPELKPMPGSTASQQRWPRWTRTANGKERNVPAQRWAAATPIPRGSTWAVRLQQRRRRG